MNAQPPSSPAQRPPRSTLKSPKAPPPATKPIPQLRSDEVTLLPATMIDDAGEWTVVAFQIEGKKLSGRIRTDSSESIVHAVKIGKELVGYWHNEGNYSFYVSAAGEIMENVKVSGTVAAIPGGKIIGTISKDELYLLVRETDGKKIIAAVEFKDSEG